MLWSLPSRSQIIQFMRIFMSSTKHRPLRPLLPASEGTIAERAAATAPSAPEELAKASSKRSIAAAYESCHTSKTKVRIEVIAVLLMLTGYSVLVVGLNIDAAQTDRSIATT